MCELLCYYLQLVLIITISLYWWPVVSDELLTVPYDPFVNVYCLLCHFSVCM